MPFYDWQVVDGALPEGLSLHRCTGAITGTPVRAGASTFTVQLRDYDELSTPVTAYTLIVTG